MLVDAIQIIDDIRIWQKHIEYLTQKLSIYEMAYLIA